MSRAKETLGLDLRVQPLLHALISALDEAYDRAAWHGTNLRGALRGVTPQQAAWRPAAGRHSIWELALHAAYWKYAVRRRLTGEQRGSFPLAGSNFWVRPEGRPTERAWKADLRLLGAMHRALRAAVVAFPLDRLEERSDLGGHSHRRMIAGVAMHDVYHAGQIQLLKRLQTKG